MCYVMLSQTHLQTDLSALGLGLCGEEMPVYIPFTLIYIAQISNEPLRATMGRKNSLSTERILHHNQAY